jgi:hypothetical protein
VLHDLAARLASRIVTVSSLPEDVREFRNPLAAKGYGRRIRIRIWHIFRKTPLATATQMSR